MVLARQGDSGCGYCVCNKRIEMHRIEHTLIMESPYIMINEGEAGMFFPTMHLMPAYIEIQYCPFCGRKLV